jgi:MtrB/PioB family decaheme-associated outer membrane protein
MTRNGSRLAAFLLATLALPAAAQQTEKKEAEEAKEPQVFVREVGFGIEGVETDTNSSRFFEYRDLPNGLFLSHFRFAGDAKFRYDVSAQDVLQDDARYHVYVHPGSVRLEADFQKIPHRFGNDAHTLLTDTAPGVLSISDTLQQTYQTTLTTLYSNPATAGQIAYPFLNQMVSPALAATPGLDLALLRERGRVAIDLTPDRPLTVRVEYFQEHRRGNRAAGTSFGFGNVVESPEPIDYTTRDLSASAEWKRGFGLLRAGLRFNQFENRIPTESFDNPFRATDSIDTGSAPASSSVGGPSFGRVSLPPDNKSVTGSAGGLFKFGKSSRLSADLSLSQWTQDAAFMPVTSNSAITAPPLPATSLDGSVDVLSFNTRFTTRPTDNLFLTARYRHYDLDEKTGRLQFAGYARFDSSLQQVPRISVPYGHTDDNAQLSASYDVGRATLEAGYRYDKRARTFREADSTAQNLGYLRLDLRASGWALLRADFEAGHRGYEGLEIERSEEASFVAHSAPTNLLAAPSASVCTSGQVCNLRYDQADKDLKRYGAHVELQPWGTSSLTFSYGHTSDDYDESQFGLLSSEINTFSVDADYSPSERFNVYALYSRDKAETFQRGRQSGSTLSLRPIDDWTSAVNDDVDTWGGGAELDVVKQKLRFKLDGSYQRVDGNNDLTTDPAGVARPGIGATDIAEFDDTKLWNVAAELQYRFPGWMLALGGWREVYEIRDANTVGLANYMPSSFFLAANDGDYKGYVAYVRATYTW